MPSAKARAWTLLGLAVSAAAGGCLPRQATRTLAALPVHELKLPTPSDPGKPPVTRRRPPHPVLHQWAVDGYRVWRHIVIHHSAVNGGNAVTFDASHRRRGWDELGYHFVIDNGCGGPDGRIEVGSRWRKQKWGAHCGGTPNNEYNNHGIGICLVGDFSETLPSAAQLASLRRLAEYLIQTYDVAIEDVIGHCDAPNTATACPGAALHAYIHGQFRDDLRRHIGSKK